MNIAVEYLYPVQASIEQWTDSRVISANDLESVLLFLVYIPNVLSQSGMKFGGYVCRHKAGQTLMTVKAREKDTPLVVFVTSDSPIGCMVRFLDLMEDDRLTWVRDRYPWI